MCWKASKGFATNGPSPPANARVNGWRMHYVDEGAADPVLLLHGNPTWGFLYRDVIPPLMNAGYRVCAGGQELYRGQERRQGGRGWRGGERPFRQLGLHAVYAPPRVEGEDPIGVAVTRSPTRVSTVTARPSSRSRAASSPRAASAARRSASSS